MLSCRKVYFITNSTLVSLFVNVEKNSSSLLNVTAVIDSGQTMKKKKNRKIKEGKEVKSRNKEGKKAPAQNSKR